MKSLILAIVSILVSILLSPRTSAHPLKDAIKAGDIQTVRQLLDSNPEYANNTCESTAKFSFAVSALSLAIQHKQKDIAELLLSRGASASAGKDGQAPIVQAVLNDYWDLIPLLVNRGANLNPDRTKAEYCPLSYATSAKTALVLIDEGADINYRNRDNTTPLHKVVAFGYLDVAQILIEHGAEVNAEDVSGYTPLHVAALERRVDMINLLLAAGADINASGCGRTPLDYCIVKLTDYRAEPHEPAYYQTIKLLIAKGACYSEIHAARAGDLEKLREIIKASPDKLNSKDRWGDPLLFCAIRERQADIVDFLVKSGVDINTVGRFGELALHTAVYAGKPETVEILLNAGADAGQKGQNGEFALHWVSRLPNSGDSIEQDMYDRIAAMLIEAGSPLNCAAEKARPNMWLGGDSRDQVAEQFRMLDVAGKNVQIAAPHWLAFDRGDTPLHSAARWGRTKIVQQLIESGAQINPRNVYGQTPLHYAVAFKHIDIVKYLLTAGADTKIQTNTGLIPSQIALRVKDNQILALLNK